MDSKKTYTREEKIKYYNWLIFDLESKLKKAQDRLHFIMSDAYQDWSSNLEKQLKEKKKAE